MEELEKDMYYGATVQTLKKAKQLRLKMTKPELILWERLKGKQLMGLRFRRQHPVNIYIADFYCHTLKLVIEIDGNIHDSQKQYDLGRTKDMEMYGLKIIRFKNSEIENNVNEVIMKIRNMILKSPLGIR